MSDINVFTFSGNLARDAEQRFTAQGKAVLSFTVANNTGYGDNEKTSWIQCAIFGKRAEGGLVQHLTKGQQVTVTGECTLNEYQNNNGETKASLNVFVHDVKLQGGKREGGQPAPQQSQGEPAPGGNFGDFDNDIPF